MGCGFIARRRHLPYYQRLKKIVSLNAVCDKDLGLATSTAKEFGIRPTSRLLASVLEFARVATAIPSEKWDANPDILVCANGTLHIPTCELQPHDPNNYAINAVPFAFDPSADAPNFKRAIQSTIP